MKYLVMLSLLAAVSACTGQSSMYGDHSGKQSKCDRWHCGWKHHDHYHEHDTGWNHYHNYHPDQARGDAQNYNTNDNTRR